MNLKIKLIKSIKPKFRETFCLNPKPKNILDIGIANNSYTECKSVFPKAKYHGVDFLDLCIFMDEGDQFTQCNLDIDPDLSQIEGKFDLIIVNHVLEHLRQGTRVLAKLCEKLTPGGVLYVELPSIRTAYKRKTRHSYHFHDDPTHVRVYSLEDLANVILSADCKLVSCGPVSTPLKNLISVPRALIGLVKGQGYGSFLLHMRGQIDHVLAIKPDAAPPHLR